MIVKISYFHILMTLLETIPDANQTLLQFIDVINLVDLLLHFSPSVSSMTQVINSANVSVYLCESMKRI